MTFVARVKDGTGAGSKRPMRDKLTEEWKCTSCKHRNSRWVTVCVDCGVRRFARG